MAGKTQEGWQDLCRAASTEKNPEKLLDLVTQINSLLLKREKKSAKAEEDMTLPRASGA
jgi:hypothetical protein